MKILLLNYHFFNYGGPDRYFFNVTRALEQRGHQVIPFAFDYVETLDTPFRDYFPEPISGPGPCLLADQKLTAQAKVRAIVRMFCNPGLEHNFRRIMRDYRPDLVYSIYLSSSMLPKILKIAKDEFGCPVFYRLSDFHMFCASYLFFRDGAVCTECLNTPVAAILHRCVKGSMAASTIRYLQMAYTRARRWYDAVDCFVCPSLIMREYLHQHAGINPGRLLHLPTFTTDLLATGLPTQEPHTPYALFFGKVVQEKGVEILLRAYSSLDAPPLDLKFVGHVTPEYREYLKQLVRPDLRSRVVFTGPQQGESLAREIRESSFVILPALWFENLPNTVLEAFSAGRPVLGTHLGSMPEMIHDGINGILVPAGNVPELAAAISRMSDFTELRNLQNNARLSYLKHYSEQAHMSILENHMQLAITKKPSR